MKSQKLKMDIDCIVFLIKIEGIPPKSKRMLWKILIV